MVYLGAEFGGFMGQILKVNLSTSKIVKTDLPSEWPRAYVGGVGFGARILYDEVCPWVSPFDPDNRLIFTQGPLSGTFTPTASRYTVVTKSPLTGYFGDASGGGFFPAELKKCGYDAIVFTGRATKPSLLLLSDGSYELRDASAYWGMNAREAERAIVNDLGDKSYKACTIGRAGERLVRFAAIMNDEADRAAARCGVGAVMGSKNLKAIVVKGYKQPKVADANALKNLLVEITNYVKTNKNVVGFTKGGTPGAFTFFYQLGDVPIHNWSSSSFGPSDAYVEKVAYPGGYERILLRNRTCYACPISCRRVSKGIDGLYGVEEGVEGPEYETVASFGPNCGISEPEIIAKANNLCNEYGLDTISAGGVIAFAMECFEKGILSEEDTKGVKLRFGEGEALLDVLRMIGEREGIGNLLAEGVRRAAAAIGKGAEDYAIHVKGLEIAMHDPRAFQGGGVHYACTPTGGRHTEGLSIIKELKTRFSTEGKGKLVKEVEDWDAFVQASGWCLFVVDARGYPSNEHLIKVFNAVTGFNLTLGDAMLLGEKIFNLKKAFNVKHGCSRSEDTLPQRLLTLPTKAGAVVKLNELLPQYYEARRWDAGTSKPTKALLQSLGLNDVATDLWGVDSSALEPKV
ncbi:MAG: aldehyde ferredoxin oxidoreductase family protein [Nitrososphaerales archaeon]